MGEERRWPREASCSGPRRGHASPRDHPALGGGSWVRLLAQVAQGPGENAPLCVQGPAPGIPGLSGPGRVTSSVSVRLMQQGGRSG